MNATQQHTDSNLTGPHPSEALPHISNVTTSPNPRTKKTKGGYKGPLNRPGQNAAFDKIEKMTHSNNQSYGGSGAQKLQNYSKAHQNPPTAVSVDGIHQNSKTQLRSGQATQQALTQQVSQPACLIVDDSLFVCLFE